MNFMNLRYVKYWSILKDLACHWGTSNCKQRYVFVYDFVLYCFVKFALNISNLYKKTITTFLNCLSGPESFKYYHVYLSIYKIMYKLNLTPSRAPFMSKR